MKRVIIESPFAPVIAGGDPRRNIEYAKACLLDSLKRGEAPFASHLLYPQVLDDANPEQRKLGMEAGFAWMQVAEASCVYTDLGISGGMAKGVGIAEHYGIPVEYRTLGAPWSRADG